MTAGRRLQRLVVAFVVAVAVFAFVGLVCVAPIVSSTKDEATDCVLPYSWSGVWSNQQQNNNNNHNNGQTGGPSFQQAESTSTFSSQSHKAIDQVKFLNKGLCVHNKDERYFFYDRVDKCFRCLFIIQRHYNVLQYRETHCDEELSDFEALCNMLSPDLPLLTMIRENANSEKCPLTDSYHVLGGASNKQHIASAGASADELRFQQFKANSADRHQQQQQNLEASAAAASSQAGTAGRYNKCLRNPSANIIGKCADNSMLRLDFQDCVGGGSAGVGRKSALSAEDAASVEMSASASALWSPAVLANSSGGHARHSHQAGGRSRENHESDSFVENENGIVVQCIASWSEGNWNYLIMKQNSVTPPHTSHGHPQPPVRSYKCLVYKDLDRPFKNTNNNNVLNPNNNFIQLSLSEDELCRDFYLGADGLNSFTLQKNQPEAAKKNDIRHHTPLADALLSGSSGSASHIQRNKHQARAGARSSTASCKFPKALNKKWKNLAQSKQAFSVSAHSLHIVNSGATAHRPNTASHNSTAARGRHPSAANNGKQRTQAQHSTTSAVDLVMFKLHCVERLKVALPTRTAVGDEDANTAGSEREDSLTTTTHTGRTNHDRLYLVNNMLECSTHQKCLLVSFKSEFILHLKYAAFNGKRCLFDSSHVIFEDFLFIESDIGISCPFSNRVYQLSDDHHHHHHHHHHHQQQQQRASPTVETGRRRHAAVRTPHTPLKLAALNQFSSMFNTAHSEPTATQQQQQQAAKRRAAQFVNSGIERVDSDDDSNDGAAPLRSEPWSRCEHYLKIGCSGSGNAPKDYTIYKKCPFVIGDVRVNEQQLQQQQQRLQLQNGGAARTKAKKNSGLFDALAESLVDTLSSRHSESEAGYQHIVAASSSQQSATPPVPLPLQQSLPVIESETNRICLAYWPTAIAAPAARMSSAGVDSQETNESDESNTYVVLSKSSNTEGFSITCSIWKSWESKRKLKITDDPHGQYELCYRLSGVRHRSDSAVEPIGAEKPGPPAVLSMNKQRTPKNSGGGGGSLEHSYAALSSSATAASSFSFTSSISSAVEEDDLAVVFDYTGSCSTSFESSGATSVASLSGRSLLTLTSKPVALVCTAWLLRIKALV